MPTFRERIETKAIEILRSNPDGVRYSNLIKQIKDSLPDTNVNHIRGTIWNLDVTRSTEVYKAGRGLFRHVLFKGAQNPSEEVSPAAPLIRESDFYAPFAEFLKNDLGECTTAIALGGRVFGDKWGTPDVIGIERSSLGEIIQRQVVIVSAEIKTDTQGLITAFGQACAYNLFSNKTYIVIPNSSDVEDKERLESLCLIFGIGLILFDSTNSQDPQFDIRVRPIKHEPDMFYVNKYMRLVPEQLFR
ncbi:MAG TPA: hypothetical protein VLH35_05765 [Candidatus Acidoferrales bacterium]|nr:hypothetical protein [Candidatus Acidoferrales bacterium]